MPDPSYSRRCKTLLQESGNSHERVAITSKSRLGRIARLVQSAGVITHYRQLFMNAASRAKAAGRGSGS